MGGRDTERQISNATETGNTGPTFLVLLILPNLTCHSELQLFPITSREEESQVSQYNEPIKAVSNLPMPIPHTPWHALPYEFSRISTHLQAVAVIPSFCLIPHEMKKCHIDRSHPKLKRFKVEAKVLPEAVEDLEKMQQEKIILELKHHDPHYVRV